MSTFVVRVGALTTTVQAEDGHKAISIAKQRLGNYNAVIVDIIRNGKSQRQSVSENTGWWRFKA